MSLTVPGIDFAWGRPNYDAIKKSGYRFVMRYVSHDPSKDLTKAELNEWGKRGIGVGLVFESTSGRALQGADAGAADAEYANARCRALGVPQLPVFFAVDFDANNSQKPAINRYIQGAAKVLGKNRTGVYGSYYVVRYLASKGSCGWFWQTYAWSGGQVHPKVHIHQYRNGANVAGLSCDLNKAKAGDIGVAWPRKLGDPRVGRWKKRLSAIRRAAQLVGWLPGLKSYAKKLEKAIKENE